MKHGNTYEITFKHLGEIVTAKAIKAGNGEPFFWIKEGKHKGCGVHITKALTEKVL